MKIDDEKYGTDGKIGHTIRSIIVHCYMTQKDNNTQFSAIQRRQ